MLPSAREGKAVWAAAGTQARKEEHMNTQSMFDQRNLCLKVAFLRQLEKNAGTKYVSEKTLFQPKKIAKKISGIF